MTDEQKRLAAMSPEEQWKRSMAALLLEVPEDVHRDVRGKCLALRDADRAAGYEEGERAGRISGHEEGMAHAGRWIYYHCHEYADDPSGNRVRSAFRDWAARRLAELETSDREHNAEGAT